MADNTKIEWTDATWNPITGCSVVSPGCTNCYAMRLAGTRLKHHPSRAGLTSDSKAGPVWNGDVRINRLWLHQPGEWRRSRRIFVCAHGDLFAEKVPDDWILDVLTVIACNPQHQFQVLTKRAERMQDFMSRADLLEDIYANWSGFSGSPREVYSWPLHNLWLGVSAEDQKRADERLRELRETPAKLRWVSAEPLLGPIDLSRHIDRIDWVVAGGESGPGARPMHPDWARSLHDQCASAGVPFLFKQWGAWAPRGPESFGYPIVDGVERRRLTSSGDNGSNLAATGCNHVWMQRLGKKAAGRLLDGVEHNGFPVIAGGFA